MKRIPIYLDGEMTLMELKRIFEAEGYHVRLDGCARIVVDRVPEFLRKDEPASNVVPMKKRRSAT